MDAEVTSSAPAVPVAAAQATTAVQSKRLLSLDAYRGLIMLFMASAGFGIKALADKLPESIWPSLKPLVEHASWRNPTPWDMIQPSFMFMVGVAMAFSNAKRASKGQSGWWTFMHAVIRSVVLVLLGVLLASNGKPHTVWEFPNVLAQIGLGYTFLYLFSRFGSWVQVLGIVAILGGYWAWFAYSPVMPVPTGVEAKDVMSGFFAHWNQGANPAAQFDVWLLNLFPRAEPFVANSGGYTTLNFIPSLATMLIGLLAGRFLLSDRTDIRKVETLLFFGILLTALGSLADGELCPIVKKIWTPSWVLFSGGITLMLLSAFYCLIEVLGARFIGWPLAIVGMNSIFVYLFYQLCRPWVKAQLHQHLASDVFSTPYATMIEECGFLAVAWLLCWWLYRSKAFLRI